MRIKDLSIKDLEKVSGLLSRYDTHGSEPIVIAVDLILNQRQSVFVKHEPEWEDECWYVGTNDFPIETFKSKDEAVKFCKRFKMKFEFWD